MDSKNEWLLLSAGFTAKFGLVFVFFEEALGFDGKASFASFPVSRLIR